MHDNVVLLLRLAADEDGATMVEYGLMIALIALVCVAAITLLGGSLSGVFSNAALAAAL